MPIFDHRNFLVDIALRINAVPWFDTYPFNIPAIRDLGTLRFDKPVTFLVGENGSGKSTLIEALAILMELNPEGGNRNFRFKTAEARANLDEFLQPTRSPRRMRNGFLLRAESHFNVASYIDAVGGAHNYGGKSLHEQSHGESFFALLQHRLTGDGLYIMDEPEAALSPTRQLSMLTRLHDLVRQGAQLIIATHSPILMADPMPITSCRVKARPI